jgi:hypothetical protein
LLCKLKLEEACDHRNWEILLYLMKRSGFGEKWRAWIEFCISTVRFSILINGASSSILSSTQDLRQGDPLSPLPFAIVIETLSKMMSTTMDKGLLDGFHWGQKIM